DRCDWKHEPRGHQALHLDVRLDRSQRVGELLRHDAKELTEDLGGEDAPAGVHEAVENFSGARLLDGRSSVERVDENIAIEKRAAGHRARRASRCAISAVASSAFDVARSA